MTFSFFNKPPLSGEEKDKVSTKNSFTLEHHNINKSINKKMEEKLKNTEVSQQNHFPS